MDATVFWQVIGAYNSQTILVQLVLMLLLAAGLVLSYTQRVKWAATLALGLANLYIGIVFFGLFGTEPIQTFFALPLYLGCGGLFVFECFKNKGDPLQKPSKWQGLLLLLFVFYPAISYALGNRFPQMVTYIMPCPVVSLSLAVYAGYHKKNRLLLLLLTVWGLTGIKSLIFNAYEDIILLLCGLYGVWLLLKGHKNGAAAARLLQRTKK